MPQENVTPNSNRTEFYKFFCPWARDRQTAASAAAAGLVAAGLLMLALVAAFLVSLLRDGWTHSHAPTLLGLAACSAPVLYGTLKQVTSAPIVGSLIGLGISGWLVVQHEVAFAAVIFVPLVCGFLTAARGLHLLNGLRKHYKV